MNSPDPSTLPLPSSMIQKNEQEKKIKNIVNNSRLITEEKKIRLHTNISKSEDITSLSFLKENTNLDTVKLFISKYIKKCGRFDNISKIILYELEDEYKIENNSLKNLMNLNSIYFDKKIERSLKILILKFSKLFKNTLLTPPSFFS